MLFVIVLSIILILINILKLFKKKSIQSTTLTNGIIECYEPYHHIKISDQQACRTIFSKTLLRPPNLGLGNLFDRWIGDCLGCINTHESAWSDLKIIFKPIFDFKTENIMEKILSDWDVYLNELFTCNVELNEPILLEKVVNDLPLKYILLVIFGETFVKKNSSKFSELQMLSKYIINEIFNNIYSSYTINTFFPTETNRKLNTFNYLWEDIMKNALLSASVKHEGVFDLVYSNYTNKKTVTYKMFSQTLVEIIYANHDVTIPSMTWLLLHYAHYGELINNSNLQQFIEESARVSPIFPTSMPKFVNSDINVNGCIIKKNTTIVIDFVEIGKSATWKMYDLDVFKPARYNDIEMKSFISRFGYGGRKCPGYKLADLLFNHVLKYLHNNWIFIPQNKKQSYNINDIPIILDSSRPFSMPLEKILIQKVNRHITYFNYPILTTDDCGFIGISVNKKSPYINDIETVKNIVSFFKKQNKHMVILIADEIAHYNFQAFENYNEVKAKKIAERFGNNIYKNFNDAIEEYNCSEQIKVCKWNELNLPDMYEYFTTNLSLTLRVNEICQNFIKKRSSPTKYLDKKSTMVKKYIYSELGVLVCGIFYGNKWYKSLYYSGTNSYLKEFSYRTDSLCNLMNDIISSEEFEDVKNYIIQKMGANSCKINGFIGIDLNSFNK